jgi:PadR family transcriptional regulator AphA
MTGSTASHRSHSPEYALLGLLYLQPSHGYELHRLLSVELGHAWRISQSQTYAILKRLETQGDLSSRSVKQENHPTLQMLKVTKAGRRRFEAWLETPTGSSVRAIRLDFITRLYFTQKLAPQKTLPRIADQAEEAQNMLSRLEARQAELPEGQLFNRLSLQLRIRQLRSVLEWLSECQAEFFHLGKC